MHLPLPTQAEDSCHRNNKATHLSRATHLKEVTRRKDSRCIISSRDTLHKGTSNSSNIAVVLVVVSVLVC